MNRSRKVQDGDADGGAAAAGLNRCPEADRLRVAKFLEGDRGTLREIEGWVAEVLRACYPMLLREADDLSQSVHEKLLRNLGSGRFEFRSSLRTYVARIAHHTAIDLLRRRYRYAPLENVSPDALVGPDNPYLELESADERALCYLALQRSPQVCRDLWRLVFLEGLGYEEVAARMGIPSGTVKSRMWHCRRKLLSLLEELRRGGRNQ